MSQRSTLFLGLCIALALPPAARAQEACTFDRCALRIQSRFFSGERIVQGVTARRVARLGLFAPHIEPLATAGDSARRHYVAFRHSHNRAGAFLLIGAVASTAAAFIILGDDNFPNNTPSTSAWVLAGGGLVFSFAGAINLMSGRDHLSQSIWFYNRSLATGN